MLVVLQEICHRAPAQAVGVAGRMEAGARPKTAPRKTVPLGAVCGRRGLDPWCPLLRRMPRLQALAQAWGARPVQRWGAVLEALAAAVTDTAPACLLGLTLSPVRIRRILDADCYLNHFSISCAVLEVRLQHGQTFGKTLLRPTFH